MNVLTIVLAIAIPLGMAALNAWINIKIKFAKDAPQAIRETKSVFSKLLNWSINSYCVVVLLWFFFVSSRPVDRFFVFVVLFHSLYLMDLHLMIWVGRIMVALEKLADSDDRLFKLINLK